MHFRGKDEVLLPSEGVVYVFLHFLLQFSEKNFKGI